MDSSSIEFPQYTPAEIKSRQLKSQLYHQRFLNAERGLGYYNCAGFVKYLLGLSDRESYIRPGDATQKGLIRYLNLQAKLAVSDFSEKQYLTTVTGSDAIAFLHNDNARWMFLHFAVPDPDPNYPFRLFQRNGFEKEEPNLSDIRVEINDPEYQGETYLVFFKSKEAVATPRSKLE